MSARLLVLENNDTWAVATRWLLADDPIRVVQVESWDECRDELRAWPAAVLVWELKHAVSGDLLDCLRELNRCFPDVLVVLAGESHHASALWLARQLGVLHAVDSIRSLSLTANLIRRHFQHHPLDDQVRREVWNRMPWGSTK